MAGVAGCEAFVRWVSCALDVVGSGGAAVDKQDGLEGALRAADEAAAGAEYLAPGALLVDGLRRVINRKITARAGDGGSSKNDTSDGSWIRMRGFLDFALHLVDSERVPAPAFIQCVDELVEESSVASCLKIFEYMEGNDGVQAMIARHAKASTLFRITFIKACMKLHSRLSREDNPNLCGRVMILLAKLLPLSDLSGVNIRGFTDTENRTEFVKLDATTYRDTYQDNGEPVDVDTYNSLWEVQNLFSDPGAAKQDVKAFASGVKRVLASFESCPVQQGSADLSSNIYNSYAIKYTTDPKMMHIQIMDPSFRCQFLLQVLFVCNQSIVESKLRKEKSKGDAPPPLSPTDSHIHDLRQVMAEAMKELRRFAGNGLITVLFKIMLREENWIRWKKEGKTIEQAGGAKKVQKCFAFERTPSGDDRALLALGGGATTPGVGEGEGGGGGGGRPKKKPRFGLREFDLGNSALNSLWNLSQDNESAIEIENQDRPDLVSLVDQIASRIQETPEDARGSVPFSQAFAWKVNRMLSAHACPGFIQHAHKDLEHLMPAIFADRAAQGDFTRGPPEGKEKEKEEGEGDGGEGDGGEKEGEAGEGEGGAGEGEGGLGDKMMEDADEGATTKTKAQVKKEEEQENGGGS